MNFQTATIEEVRKFVSSLEMPVDFNQRILDSFQSIHSMYRKSGSFMARCSRCGHVQIIDRKDHKHHSPIKCDGCGTESKVYDVKSNTNFYYHMEQIMVTLLQKSGNIFVFSRFIATSRIVDQRETYNITELECRVLDGQEIHSFSRDYKNAWERRRYRGSIGGFREVHFQPTSFVSYLQDTDLKNSSLGEWIDRRQSFTLENFVMARKYPFVGTLWTSGMTALYVDFIEDHTGKIEARSLLKRHRGFVKRHDLNMRECKAIRDLEKIGIPISDFSVRIVHSLITEILLEVRKLIHKSIQTKQIAKYLMSTGSVAAGVYYSDYIKMMEKIETPVNHQTVFPQDLKKAHDDVTARYNAIKHELKNTKYRKYLVLYKKMELKKGDYAIVVPSELQEIQKEGKILSHCVSTYIERVANGETVILFVRKVEDLEKPFFTLEYRDGVIRQCRGYENTDMPPEVKAFTDNWLKWVKSSKRKEKVKKSNEQRVAA